MPDNVDNYVMYAVWDPIKGWIHPGSSPSSDCTQPYLWSKHHVAKNRAKKYGGQLVTFDLVPTLRSWPSEEPTETP